jgi:hypothetical protein
MKKRGKRILRVSAIALASVFLLVVGFSLYVYFHKPALKGYIERTLSKKPGLTVTIGRLNYRLFPLRLEADSVKVVFVNVLGRADVFIARAEGLGSFQHVLQNQKPYLDTLMISGLKLDFAEDPNAPPSGLIKIRDLTRMISGYLEYVSELTIRDSALHLGLPVEGMDIAAAGIDLRASGADKTAVGLAVNSFNFRNSKPAAMLATGLRFDAAWPRSGPFQLEGNLDLRASSVSLPEKQWQGPGFGLKAGFRADEKSVGVDPVAVDFPGLLSLSGSGRAELSGNRLITAVSKLDVRNIDLLKRTFAPILPPGLPVFSFDGPAQWEGEVRQETAAGAGRISVNGALRIPPGRFTMKQGDISAGQILQAELHLEGDPKNLRVKGTLEGRGGEIANGLFRASGVSFRLPVEISGSRVSFSSLNVQAKVLVLPAGTQRLKVDGVSLGGRAELDYVHQSAVIETLAIEVPGLGSVNLSGTFSPGPRRQIALSLKSQNLDIGNIFKKFSDFIPETLAAWQPAGVADLSLDVRSASPGGNRYQVRGTVDLSKAAFQDSSGTIVSEGLEPHLRFEADNIAPSFPKAAASSGPIPFSFELDLAKGESLWKDAYFNWQNDPVRLELKGEFDPAAAEVRQAVAALKFAPLGELKARGSVSIVPRPRLDFHLALPSVDLAPFYAFLKKMRPTQPSALEVQGKAEADADIRFETSFKLRGKIMVRDATAKRKDGSLVLAGIDLDFPFSVGNGIRPGDEKDDYSIAPGSIRIGQLKTPVATLDPVRIDFIAARNLFLLFPVDLGLWGARLGLGQSVLSVSPASLGMRGVSTLTLADLDFSRLPFNSETFKLTGKASIPEGGLEISPREFRFKGRLLADLFGGRLTLDGLRVTDVFSPGRRIMFQAELAGLDMDQLTDVVPFGDVTGIVDVSLHNVALSYGQPESFSMTIRSVRRKGVPQKFSLKAVDNLSVISSGGQSASPSGSFLTKFIHSFNYKQIGIACSLKNDIFTLRGTVIEGGVQYLIRRATFFGIDVVNAKPVNKISFKDMLGRMKRVGQSQEKK